MEALCKSCEKSAPYQTTERFKQTWKLYQLDVARYPFQPDDLSYEQWLSIAEMKLAYEEGRI